MNDEVLKALLLLEGRIRALGTPGTILWNILLEGGQEIGAFTLGRSTCRSAVVFFVLGKNGLGIRTSEDVHRAALQALCETTAL